MSGTAIISVPDRGRSSGAAQRALPWWTWPAPLPLFHVGTWVAVQDPIHVGTASWYLPFALAVVLVHWWGPRVLAALYINAVACIGLWGLPWHLAPVYALPETAAAGASWLLFSRLARGDAGLAGLRDLVRFLCLGLALPVLLQGLWMHLQFMLIGPPQGLGFWPAVVDTWFADLLCGIAVALPLLVLVTPRLAARGLTIGRPTIESAPLLPPNWRSGHVILLIAMFATPVVAALTLRSHGLWFVTSVLLLAVALSCGAAATTLATAWAVIIVTAVAPQFVLPSPAVYDESQLRMHLLISAIAALLAGRVVDDLRREIDGRRSALRALAESEHRFRRLAETAPVMIWTSDATGRCDYFNPAWLAFRGRSFIEEIGHGWLDGVHPDDRERTDARFAEQVARREPYQSRYRLRRHDGAYRWVLDAGLARYDEHGDFAGYVGTCVDITEQVEAEHHERRERESLGRALDAARADLVRQTRLAAIGQIAASVAHDLRNPLSAIRHATFLLRRRKDDPETVLDYLGAIDDEVRRAEAFINHLLEFRRERVANREPSDLAALARGAFEQLHTSDELVLDLRLDAEPFEIEVDPTQFERVLSNLMLNAAQAMGGVGRIEVNAHRLPDCDVIEVTDNGPGVDPAARDRLFDPLFSTRPTGTGLGLAICRQIVERHGGSICCLAPEGKGAVFRIELPRVDALERPAAAEVTESTSPD